MNNGGMGNQMFQYAVARKLQEQYNMDIICDLDKYSYKGTNATKRKYCLDQFLLSERLHYMHSTYRKALYAAKRSILEKIFNKLSPDKRFAKMTEAGMYVPTGYFDYYKESTVRGGTIYVNGLFQAHSYFDEIQPILKREFKLKRQPSKKVSNLVSDMMQKNSVCIHWRRGDYLSSQYADSLLICGEKYYKTAMTYIEKHVQKPEYYLFTNSLDDAEYIKKHIHFQYQINYINLMLEQESDDLEDFRLMCSCRHFIISNSTYSWWAQYLSDNPQKIVCAPSVWNKKMYTGALYQDDWTILPV